MIPPGPSAANMISISEKTKKMLLKQWKKTNASLPPRKALLMR